MDELISIINTNRSLIHMGLHVLVPLVLSRFFPEWKKLFILMMLTMLVDLDHLLANPLYDPNRCSIGFHPLHSFWVLPVYPLLAIIKKTRWIGIGLVIHMLLDLIDCWWMKSI